MLPQYAAKMHTVEIAWRLVNTRDIIIGPEPKLVLALRARRDVEMFSLLVDFPGLRTQEGQAESLLAEVPHVVGLRVLRPEGEPWVRGQEDVAAGPMLSAFARPDERIAPVEECRWHGGTVRVLEYNVNPHPCIYWCWRGRAIVPRGKSLGVLVRSTVPTICRVRMAGE